MNKSSGEPSIGETTTTAPTCNFIDPLYCNRLLQISIGSAMFIASSSVMVLIMLVIIAQFKSGNLSKNGSPIFVLSTWSLCVSILILAFLGFYIGPTIIFQTYWPDKFAAQRFNLFIAHSLIGLIFSGSIFNVIIAINRALVMQAMMTNMVLSRKVYNIISLIIFPIGFSISYIPILLLPCCKIYFFYFSYTFLSLQYDKNGDRIFDAVFIYVYRPFYIITTIIPIICYAYIFGYAYWMRRQLKTVNNQQNSELIRSLMFASIFFFYMCAWFYYDGMFIDEIIPQFLPLSILGLVFMLLEAMMNGILQATMIASIRETLKKMLRIKRKPENIAVTSYALQVRTTNNTDNGNNSLALTNNFIHGVI